MNDFSIIKSYVESDEKFPVPFDSFWLWIGFARKDNAKKTLEKNFEADLDFSAIWRKSTGGRPTEEISLTTECAKGFAMLAQTQKGKEVRAYFIRCEQELKELVDKIKKMSPAEYGVYQAQRLLESERRLLAQEAETKRLSEQTARIEAKITTINTDYYTVAGFASLRGRKVDISRARILGQRAAKLSKELDYELGTAYDSKYGTVNTYHIDILKEVFDGQ